MRSEDILGKKMGGNSTRGVQMSVIVSPTIFKRLQEKYS
jgi:hypothetical protein